MADSENSTSPPAVSRRLATGAITAAILSFIHRSFATETPPPDPALPLWRDWRAAYSLTLTLCREQQCLETELADSIGFPYALVDIPDASVPTTVFSTADLDGLLATVPGGWSLRAKAEAELLDHQARWDDADQRLGYSAAKQAEEAAGRQAQQLAEALWAMPADSFLGVAGKLDAVLAFGEPGEDCEEFPWPQIRSARDDLMRIGRRMTPGLVFPGT